MALIPAPQDGMFALGRPQLEKRGFQTGTPAGLHRGQKANSISQMSSSKESAAGACSIGNLQSGQQTTLTAVKESSMSLIERMGTSELVTLGLQCYQSAQETVPKKGAAERCGLVR